MGQKQNHSSNQILGQWLSGLTYIIALEPRRAQASLCMLFKIVHGLCFFPPDILPQGQTIVSVQTSNYCSNNHLLVQMHIFTLVCFHRVLFMRGTCSLSPLFTYLCSNIVNYITYNPVHNILIAPLFLCLCLICNAVFLMCLSHLHPLAFAKKTWLSHNRIKFLVVHVCLLTQLTWHFYERRYYTVGRTAGG